MQCKYPWFGSNIVQFHREATESLMELSFQIHKAHKDIPYYWKSKLLILSANVI